MKLLLLILVVIYCSCWVVEGLLSSSCSKPKEVCWANSDCCAVNGRRMVCAAHLEICGKKICCITEVEEQQERQAAIIRNRKPKSKRFRNTIFDEESIE